ncbi:uncharacterized protein Z520_05256 [Fonsecaea multimorphosa CBS 102226]|uniref:Uncharacterized protein n=1 Tax=Fonsecaea multimorphosa CBS 102226 TaxID=1442371 RepID=A0A0D2HA91_9EURO|nr:uncharacterized protein Z520_05256 [Fonsecaea multimorphosa CBS 102226]KIX98795.1 hypothetical protein Z520_05256 [Fonsecaea multimorphosa CBS 102226]OAL25076.1 hypothetical protein AYO22_04953 [Fonsecaea multimorphosa]
MAHYAPVTAEWHPSLANQHRSNLLSHGKRRAEDELESQSNISSHFKKLRLNQANNSHSNALSHQYSQPSAFTPSVAPSSPSQVQQIRLSPPTSPSTVSFRPHIANTDARPALPLPTSIQLDYGPPPPPHPTPVPQMSIKPPTLPDADFMTVDDTPHRIIIHDLESEIAQIEAEEAAHNATIFLSDIDKQVSRVPQKLLETRNHDRLPQPAGLPPENLNTALVLYRDPSSISVPEEDDVVRKTIIEARRRAREKTAEEQREKERREAQARALQLDQKSVEWDDAMTDNSFHGGGMVDDDVDAMEIE